MKRKLVPYFTELFVNKRHGALPLANPERHEVEVVLKNFIGWDYESTLALEPIARDDGLVDGILVQWV